MKKIENIYEVGYVNEVDRQNYKIDLNKPYTIVCGCIGVGKSSYIKIMKQYNPDMQYLEVGRLETVMMYVRKMASNIIEINRRLY